MADLSATLHSVGNGVRHQWLQLRYHLQQAMDDSARYSRNNMPAIAAFGGVSYIVYYLLYTSLFPAAYEDLPLRVAAALVCLPVVLVNRWPDRWQTHLPLYWFLGLTFCLPFFFTLMLLQNSQYQAPHAPLTMVWPLSNVVAIALLTMLIQDALLVLVAYGGGSLMAWLLFLLLNPDVNWQAVQQEYVAPLPVFVFLLVLGALSNRHRKMLEQEMLRAAGSVGASIAHELRTPLLGIKSSASGLHDYLPTLVDAYESAREAGLEVKPIRRRHLLAIRDALERIDSETEYSNRVIDMLLINSGRASVVSTEFSRYSALACIRLALERYPFASDVDRARIKVDESVDFQFRGSDILFTHVIFNLIKNALYFVAESDGEVRIWLERGRRHNRLVCRDNGAGIDPRILPRIFDTFFTSLRTGRGTGIGLAFCRMVVEGFGGAITCDSRVDEYTQFTITLPRIAED